MSDEDKSVETQETTETTETPTDPDQSQTDKSEETQAPSQELPEKFKGKDVKDIVKSYEELEKKLGETSQTVQEYEKAQKTISEWEALLTRNPDLHEAALKARQKELGKTGDGEAKKPATTSESDQFLRNRTLSEFRQSLGKYNKDKQDELFKGTAKEFMELRDPGGTKDFLTLVRETPLEQLDGLIQKSFFLATMDSAAQTTQPDFASIGSMPSSTQKSSSNDLTEDEKAAAEKIFGMTPEEYKKYKK